MDTNGVNLAQLLSWAYGIVMTAVAAIGWLKWREKNEEHKGLQAQLLKLEQKYEGFVMSLTRPSDEDNILFLVGESKALMRDVTGEMSRYCKTLKVQKVNDVCFTIVVLVATLRAWLANQLYFQRFP